jgi:phytoene synthase
MFADPRARKRLIALYGFNSELARVAESVSEPALGEIRLQWWRETLDGVHQGTPRNHPVAMALAETGITHLPSRHLLDRLIDARAADLEDAPMADRGALIAYAEGTSSTLLILALEALEVSDQSARDAAHHLGRAWALIGLIRATGHLARSGRLLLPGDLMTQHGLTKTDIGHASGKAALQEAVSDVASWAAEDLGAADTQSTPRAALPVTLIGSLARMYLTRLQRARYDPFDERLSISPLRRQLELIRRAITNRP